MDGLRKKKFPCLSKDKRQWTMIFGWLYPLFFYFYILKTVHFIFVLPKLQ
jgi:hypothetical protein